MQVLFDRKEYINPDTKLQYTAEEIRVGTVLNLGNQKFVIIKVDGKDDELVSDQ